VRLDILCHFTVIGKKGDLYAAQVASKNMDKKYLKDITWERRQHCSSCDADLDPILP